MRFNLFRKKSLVAETLTPEQEKVRPSLPTVEPPQSLFDIHATIFRQTMATIPEMSSDEIEAMLTLIAAFEGGYLNQGAYHRLIYDIMFLDREWRWPELDDWLLVFAELDAWPGKLRSAKMVAYDKYKGAYTLLMSTIHGRAKNTHDQKKYRELNLKYQPLVVFEEDRKFINLAISKDPDAVPPFFPGDATVLKAIIPGFS